MHFTKLHVDVLSLEKNIVIWANVKLWWYRFLKWKMTYISKQWDKEKLGNDNWDEIKSAKLTVQSIRYIKNINNLLLLYYGQSILAWLPA